MENRCEKHKHVDFVEEINESEVMNELLSCNTLNKCKEEQGDDENYAEDTPTESNG